MNLSPSWVDRLARHGFEAVHWSTIGAATAPDVEILTFANKHHFVVITNDLDFSAISRSLHNLLHQTHAQPRAS
jgi:predicted nuclease of predicted toxin-antitoxin system